ncbi:MAG: CbiX/SirB N-terminal domain-containing protein [Granulosicoccaceae bacterium]
MTEFNDTQIPEPSPTSGIIIVDHGSRRLESNEMFETFVSNFAAVKGYDIVEAAHMEIAEPSIETAMRRCVERGASVVYICPYFFAPGRHWKHDIPAITKAAAAKVGVLYAVTAPIGLHPAMIEVIDQRLQHCIAYMAGEAPSCDCCDAEGCSMKGYA